MTSKNDDMVRNWLAETLRCELPVLRARIGVSQEALAEKVGISRQTFSSIETGKKKMTWKNFLLLVSYFQNNEQTKAMLDQITNFNEQLEKAFNAQDIVS